MFISSEPSHSGDKQAEIPLWTENRKNITLLRGPGYDHAMRASVMLSFKVFTIPVTLLLLNTKDKFDELGGNGLCTVFTVLATLRHIRLPIFPAAILHIPEVRILFRLCYLRRSQMPVILSSYENGCQQWTVTFWWQTSWNTIVNRKQEGHYSVNRPWLRPCYEGICHVAF